MTYCKLKKLQFAVLNKCARVSVNVETIAFGHIHQLLLCVPEQTQHADAVGSMTSSSALDRCRKINPTSAYGGDLDSGTATVEGKKRCAKLVKFRSLHRVVTQPIPQSKGGSQQQSRQQSRALDVYDGAYSNTCRQWRCNYSHGLLSEYEVLYFCFQLFLFVRE